LLLIVRVASAIVSLPIRTDGAPCAAPGIRQTISVKPWPEPPPAVQGRGNAPPAKLRLPHCKIDTTHQIPITKHIHIAVQHELLYACRHRLAVSGRADRTPTDESVKG